MSATCEEIAKAVQELVYAVLKREEAHWNCCPKMSDSEYQRGMQEVNTCQDVVTATLKKVKAVTGRRFKGYLDSEIILSVFLFATILHNARALAMNSNRLGDVIGRDKPEQLVKLYLRLTSGASPALAFMSLKWDAEEDPSGQYKFQITQPEILTKLIFGNAVLMM